MPLALSTRHLGRRPFTAAALLDALRAIQVRDCALSDAAPQPDAAELAHVLQPAGSRVVAVEVRFTAERDGDAPPSLLAPSREAGQAARRAIGRAAGVAKTVGARIVVLHLGEHALERHRERHEELRARWTTVGVDDEARRLARAIEVDLERRLEPDLERACRGLFEICRAEPEILFAVATPESFVGFPSRRALGLLLSELRGSGVGYWHDTGAAAMHEKVGLAPKGSFAGDHAASILGVAVHDVAGSEMHLPPGSGEIDFQALRDDLPSGVPAVIEVDSRFSRHEVELAATLLRSLGY